MRKGCLIVCLSILSLVSYAQIQGRIVDTEKKLPISFATVTYKIDSETKGVVADVQGNIIIPHNNVQQYTVSCIGYKAKEITDLSKQIIIEFSKNIFIIKEL